MPEIPVLIWVGGDLRRGFLDGRMGKALIPKLADEVHEETVVGVAAEYEAVRVWIVLGGAVSTLTPESVAGVKVAHEGRERSIDPSTHAHVDVVAALLGVEPTIGSPQPTQERYLRRSVKKRHGSREPFDEAHLPNEMTKGVVDPSGHGQVEACLFVVP